MTDDDGANRRRVPTVPVVVALLGLLLTAGGAGLVSSAQRERDLVRLQSRTREAADAVSSRIDACVALLQAGSGLFATDRHVSIQEFRAFTRGLELRRRYPGVQGIGYSRRVPADELSATLAEMAAAGTPAFLRPAEPRPEYNVVVFLEPLDEENRHALGYDMFTEPVRRAAMERARDGGEPAASGAVTLVQERDDIRPGFLVYVPAYDGPEPPRSVDERRRRHHGYVYAPFRIQDVLGGLIDGDMRVQVFDGEAANQGGLVYDSHRDEPPQVAESAGQRIIVTGRSFTLVLRPLAAWRGRRTASSVWVGGLVVTALLVGLTTIQARARHRAERLLADLARSERELRAHEAELQRLVQEAQAASRLKDEFLATVSHELRTPLQSILGWTSLMRNGDLDPARMKRAVETIDRNARAQAQIVEDVLDLSRITSGRLRLETSLVELGPVIQAAVDVVRPAAEARQLALDVQIQPGQHVRADPARLQQVFWNLLSNAVKFTPAGGRVTVRSARTGPVAEVAVTDTGQGISAEFLPHVFEAFRQQDQTRTRRFGGLGLGLSIVRHLIETQGGTVSAGSAGVGKGATFTVRLPEVPAAVGAVTEAGGAMLEGRGRPDLLRGLRVLVVDDHEDTRDTVASMLGGAGAEVATAESAEEAWGLLAGQLFDVLVCDIAMPGEDGLSFIVRVRALDATEGGDLPAVALTAHARIEERTRCLEAGFQRHLAKPVDVAELLEVVRDVAGSPLQ